MWQTKYDEIEKKLYEHNHALMSNDDGTLTSVAELLQRTALTVPNNIAIFYQENSYSYITLYQAATMFSKKLLTRGIKPYDKILLLIDNQPAFYAAYFGILQIGAIVVPVNVLLTSLEIAHIVEDAEPVAFVVASEFLSLIEQDDQKNDYQGEGGDREREGDRESRTKKPIFTEKDLIFLHKQDLQDIPAFKVHSLPAHEMTALLYTSGTTGKPKGVMLSSKNIITNIIQGISRFQLNNKDRIFCALPLFHSFAQNTSMWTSIACGSAVILIHKIDRTAILKGLRHNPTIFLGIPALFGLLCLLRRAPLDSIRVFISGGDALPDKIRAMFALIYRRTICNGYGMTEASPMISGDVSGVLSATNMVGKPFIGIECAFKDDIGNNVAQGTIGQLWVKGENVMLGYYKAPEMTDQVLKDGWLCTGDLAYCDDKGQIIISGRAKDLIIHKGLNIYPQEIENIILTHPNVIRVGVVGKTSDDVGEWPIAFVQLRTAQNGAEKQLRSLCLENLATYKVPRDFYCSTDPLFTTTTGKVDKKALRTKIAGMHLQEK